jgi:hypothetical protein
VEMINSSGHDEGNEKMGGLIVIGCWRSLHDSQEVHLLMDEEHMPLLIDFSNPISVCDVYQEGNSHLSPLLLARSSQLSMPVLCNWRIAGLLTGTISWQWQQWKWSNSFAGVGPFVFSTLCKPQNKRTL